MKGNRLCHEKIIGIGAESEIKPLKFWMLAKTFWREKNLWILNQLGYVQLYNRPPDSSIRRQIFT
jgi:hypothetical protein